jgi:6-pyruvoyltetrahydropterin/6-carboxytetrahydropterin synthase
MFTIAKRFEFAASHRLDGLAPDHPCTRLHGHNYSVEIELAAPEVDSVGFVLDYRSLDLFKRWVDDTLDHRHLNDVLADNPSAENLARYIHHVVRGLVPRSVTLAAVRVCETPKTMAEYRP